MLIDRCVIEVRSGKGGDGAISFLQDKMTQWGGPDGGNGGHGGSIYFVATSNLNTLYTFRHSRAIIAEDGGKGLKKNMFGKDAKDVEILVPMGTVVYEEGTGRLLADLSKDGERVLVAKGGRGGRGNAAFKSSRRRIPRVAENGHPGERKRLILELKMLADAALVGFPSVGKSTLLNVATRAHAETAAYPFTTLEPNLGVVELKDGRRYVLADMPGLIEGAHEGKGLGTRFLRHIERCRVLIHLVSMDGIRDPYSDYEIINKELQEYGCDLEKRPQIVVASMMDLEGAAERKAEFDKKLGFASMPLSSFSREGLEEILSGAADLVERTPLFPLKNESSEEEFRIYDARVEEKKKEISIVKVDRHYYSIKGEEIERKAALINTSKDEGMEKLLRLLEKSGVEKKLKEAGVKNGETVAIGKTEFVYSESEDE